MNEKEIALNLIDALEPVVTEIENYFWQFIQIDQSIERLHTEIKKEMEDKKNRLEAPAIISLIAGMLLFFIGREVKSHNGLLFVVLPVLLAGFAAYRYFVIAKPGVSRLRPNAEKMKAIKRLEAEREQLSVCADSFRDQNMELLNTFPSDYMYSEAISFIKRCLLNCRADSLKEAINLYEDKLYKDRMEEELQSQHAEQLAYLERIHRQAARAADNAAAAVSAAAWDVFSRC